MVKVVLVYRLLVVKLFRLLVVKLLVEDGRPTIVTVGHYAARLTTEVRIMDEGIERDHTSGGGGLPTLPGLNLSTIQPSRRGFYRIHVCEGKDKLETIYIDARVPVQ
jgi:hypothetical protein